MILKRPHNLKHQQNVTKIIKFYQNTYLYVNCDIKIIQSELIPIFKLNKNNKFRLKIYKKIEKTKIMLPFIKIKV